MLRIWARILKDQKVLKDTVYEAPEAAFMPKRFETHLREICLSFDLSTPLLLKSHLKSLSAHGLTTFKAHEFMEPVDFEELTIKLIAENEEEKNRSFTA
jgi:hypothetical protein